MFSTFDCESRRHHLEALYIYHAFCVYDRRLFFCVGEQNKGVPHKYFTFAILAVILYFYTAEYPEPL